MVELELGFRFFDSQSSALSMASDVFDVWPGSLEGELVKSSRGHENYGVALCFKSAYDRTWARKNRSGCNFQFEMMGPSFSEAP